MEDLKTIIIKMFCKHKYDIFGWGYEECENHDYKKIFVYYRCNVCGKMKKDVFTNQFIVENFEKIHADKHIFY